MIGTTLFPGEVSRKTFNVLMLSFCVDLFLPKVGSLDLSGPRVYPVSSCLDSQEQLRGDCGV